MAAKQTVQVPHLDAKVGYAIANGGKLDPSKPTCVLINALCTAAEFYAEHFANDKLTAAANLVVIEALGHGATVCNQEHFTAWDTALVALQAMEALGIEKACLAGASQAGWTITRMALLAPEKVQGIIPIATSMDCESADSRSKGCWDPAAIIGPYLQEWTTNVPTPDFVPGDHFTQPVLGLGFGPAATPSKMEYWTDSIRRVYAGDEGRRKLKMALICVAERDGLLFRLGYVKCPVHWLHGEKDPVFSSAVAAEQIKMFTGSQEAKIDFLDSDAHFLNHSHPKEVEQAILEMVAKV